MSALYSLLDDFKEHLKIPFYILMKQRTVNSFNISIYYKENDINLKKELEYLNFLFVNYDLVKMGYQPFEVKEIISLRRDYSSTYIFTSREQLKKMSLKKDPSKILDYFNNVVDPDKAKELHSLCLARSVCHLSFQINSHSRTYNCRCFVCRIFRILLQVLFSRGHQKLLLVITRNNYMSISDNYVTFKYLTLGK